MGELPWPKPSRGLHAMGGYNFEDSILISERVVKEDFTLVSHIRSSVYLVTLSLVRKRLRLIFPMLVKKHLRTSTMRGLFASVLRFDPAISSSEKYKKETQLTREAAWSYLR